MNILTIDLEMNQPSGKIIQVGCVVGDLITGEILAKYSSNIKIDEPIAEFITRLTGITDEQMDEGGTLINAYEEVKKLYKSYGCYAQIFQWGGGDCRTFMEQIYPTKWELGRTSMNVKNLYQFKRLINNKKTQGGLARACINLGTKFNGTKHTAIDDAVNTFVVAVKMKELFL